MSQIIHVIEYYSKSLTAIFLRISLTSRRTESKEFLSKSTDSQSLFKSLQNKQKYQFNQKLKSMWFLTYAFFLDFIRKSSSFAISSEEVLESQILFDKLE